MADPLWTDTIRDDLHDNSGYIAGLGKLPKCLEFFFHAQNLSNYLINTTDETAGAKLSKWRITAGKKGTDTDADGWVYCSVVDESPGAGQATLNCYSDSARSVLVATGSAANGATITLAAQANKFLAGTVLMGAITANFTFRLMLSTPPAKRLEQLFDGTYTDDAQIKAFMVGVLARMSAGANAMKVAAQDGMAFFLRASLRRNLVAVSDQSALIIPGIKQRSGVVTQEPRGLLEDWRQAQVDNSAGSGAIEAAAGVFAGAVAYPGPWDGSAVTPTYGQRSIAAIITGTCVKTLTSSAPEFRLTRKPTDTRRAPNGGTESEVLADRPLRIGANWMAPEWGISSLTINYLPTITNTVNTPLTTTATLWSVTGMTSENSALGILYARYVTSDTTLRFYRSSAGAAALDADELVAQVTTSATSTVFTTDANDSGIVIVGKTGAALGNGDTGTVNFNVPAATQPAAYFTITVTVTTEPGEWVKALRDRIAGGQDYEPNTGAGLDIVDGQILAGIPFINAANQGVLD